MSRWFRKFLNITSYILLFLAGLQLGTLLYAGPTDLVVIKTSVCLIAFAVYKFAYHYAISKSIKQIHINSEQPDGVPDDIWECMQKIIRWNEELDDEDN